MAHSAFSSDEDAACGCAPDAGPAFAPSSANRRDSSARRSLPVSVRGSRRADGWPAALFDAHTGKLERAEAAHYHRYDIARLLREHPEKYGPIFLQRIRLICGDADDFYLNEAVALLKADVDRLAIDELPEGKHGYVKLLPGLDHGSIYGSDAMRVFPQEMLDHLRRNGHMR